LRALHREPRFFLLEQRQLVGSFFEVLRQASRLFERVQSRRRIFRFETENSDRLVLADVEHVARRNPREVERQGAGGTGDARLGRIMKAKLKKISEQVIVITGASSGIGLATAREAAEKGAMVVVAAREESALLELVDEMKKQNK